MVKVSDLIAEFLKEKGIDTAFGIIGSANSHIFDSIHKLGYTKIINVHNEQSAVIAMGAYYRASGKLSVALVTAGGGTTNAVTGVVSNWADSIPGLIISGQENYNYVVSQEHMRMYGTQGLNASKMVKEVTKRAISFYDGMDIQSTLEQLHELSTSGRPGPCWLDVPMNLQAKMVDRREWKKPEPKRFNKIDVEDLIQSINKSKRPVIVAGHGIRLSGSKKAFNSLVDHLRIPVLTTWSGIDLIDNDNINFYGRFGLYGQRSANLIVQNSDLVVVLGSRLALPQVGYDFNEFARDAEIYVVDIDPTEAKKYDRVKPIIADVADVINELYCESYRIWGYKEEWEEKCDGIKSRYPWVDEEMPTDKGYVNSYKFIDVLSNYLKENHIVVTDMGTALLSGHQAIKLKKGQTMFTSLGLGEMGYGLPGALGAALACPEKPVLCLNCDGGMMMNLQEAHTIVENNLPVKLVIFNNDGYLMIKHTQKMLFKGDYTSVNKNTGVGLPSFKDLMPAFGYKYFEMRNWRNEKIVEEFLDSEGAACLEVYMNPEQDFVPKVKGVLKEDGTIFAPPIEEMSPLLSLDTMKKEMASLSEKSKQIKR